MAISQKLGSDYEAIRASARLKEISVKLNDIDFKLKVRIPVKREMEELQAKITTPNQDLVTQIYTNLSAPIKKTLDEAGKEFVEALNQAEQKIKITDDDIFIDGKSIKEIAQMSAIWQSQVEQYFGLLQSATGEPINETYDEICDEFPDIVIREIVQKIDSAIRPNYQDTKKN